MPIAAVTLRLRERLGEEAAEDLALAFEGTKHEMLAASQERFDARLMVAAAEIRTDLTRTQFELRREMTVMDAALRVTLAEGLSKVRTEMSDMRADILRWSFLFWIGQVVATASIVAFMLRSVAR